MCETGPVESEREVAIWKTLLAASVLVGLSVALLGEHFWLGLCLGGALYPAFRAFPKARREQGASGGHQPARVVVGICGLAALVLGAASLPLISGTQKGPEVGQSQQAGGHGSVPEYTTSVGESGVFPNGAEGVRLHAYTEASTREEFRAIATDLDSRRQEDFVWVDFLGPEGDGFKGVATLFRSPGAAEVVDNEDYSPQGGAEGDGIYLSEPEKAQRYGISPETPIFEVAGEQ